MATRKYLVREEGKKYHWQTTVTRSGQAGRIYMPLVLLGKIVKVTLEIFGDDPNFHDWFPEHGVISPKPIKTADVKVKPNSRMNKK